MPARQRAVDRLWREVDKIDGPLIVMGDFNTSDREPRYAQLAARMHDAFRETNWGFGFTFPDHKRFGPLTFPFPLIRIDYVWSKGGVLPAAAHVECNNTGADHCFLVADLRVGTAEVAKSLKPFGTFALSVCLRKSYVFHFSLRRAKNEIKNVRERPKQKYQIAFSDLAVSAVPTCRSATRKQ